MQILTETQLLYLTLSYCGPWKRGPLPECGTSLVSVPAIGKAVLLSVPYSDYSPLCIPFPREDKSPEGTASR